MKIYRCDKCSREDGTVYEPCILVDNNSGSVKPTVCPYLPHYMKEADKAEWVKCDKMPEDVKI